MTFSDAEDGSLRLWSSRVIQALQLLDLDFDHGKIIEAANESADAVAPHAGALSAFIIGYAAGTASTQGRQGTQDAVEAAADKVIALCRHGESGGPDEEGWAKTAQ